MSSADDIRQQGLDKFYTKPDIAKKCIDYVGRMYDWDKWDLVVEPSAGNGSFLKQIPSRCKIGMDIQPENTNDNEPIIKHDFLKYVPDNMYSSVLVIGNPPFGKCSSLAIRFFNHAAQWADVIAFIVPRTFRRVSVQNKLDFKFHLMFDTDIPLKPCAFVPPMMAKCCFQIWKKETIVRHKIIYSTTHPDWEFYDYGPLDEKQQPTPPKNADFALRAYGGKCGEIKRTELGVLRPKSWHWIKSNIPIERLISRFDDLDYSLAQNTARQNSIGRGELVYLYTIKFGST